jgi:hypothetical protein
MAFNHHNITVVIELYETGKIPLGKREVVHILSGLYVNGLPKLRKGVTMWFEV